MHKLINSPRAKQFFILGLVASFTGVTCIFVQSVLGADNFLRLGLVFNLTAFIVYGVLRFISLRKAGPIILIIAQHGYQKFDFLGIGLGLLGGILGILQYVVFHEQLSGLATGSIYIFIVFLIITQSRELHVVDNGFLAYGDLIPWHKIESCKWNYDGDKYFSLELVRKGKLPIVLRQITLSIPIPKQHLIQRILLQQLPKLDTTYQNRA